MTQEEKARAYDEAKERMRAFLKEWENCGAYGEAMEKARSVFPEFAESEDEKIRKWLVDYAIEMIAGLESDISRSTYDGIKGHDPEAEAELAQWQKARAYLEKQKDIEDRWIEDRGQCFWDGVEEGKMLAEKQKEQKPAEWDKLQEDFRNINEAFEDGKKEVVAHPEKYGLCKPAEWSEEDEKLLDKVEALLDDYCDFLEDESSRFIPEVRETISRLKSLRPQPKKELSIEKAIQWLDDTFYFLDNSSGRGRDCEITTHDFDSLEEMYDSFRKAVTVDSESHWKPSEEQMEALKDAVRLFKETHFEKFHYKIESLYEQLKKL